MPNRRPTDAAFLLRSLLEIVVVALFVVMFVVQPFRVPSASMEPTLRVGDLALLNRQAFAPSNWFHGLMPQTTVRRGDLVVFLYPVDPSKTLVKRVVALPGDRLHMRHGHLYLNGVAQAEPYATYSAARHNAFRDDFPALQRPDPNVEPAWWVGLRAATQIEKLTQVAELTVPPDSYFVLGDNRNDSEDSRYWGFVPRDAVLGRPVVVYLSKAAGSRVLR